jgi:hypothetical protein
VLFSNRETTISVAVCLWGVLLAGLPAIAPAQIAAPPALLDLSAELDRPGQAGGRIVVKIAQNGRPFAYRDAAPPADRDDELAWRRENLAIIHRLNLAVDGEVEAETLRPGPAELALLERFALSDAGAVWLREVVNEDIALFNKGYLEIRPTLYYAAMKPGTVAMSDFLTGQQTLDGLFANAQLFRFHAFLGYGASARPGTIGLGTLGFREHFPYGGQVVDPIAILSHEFGHTRFGDPTSGGSILGEARTVERYENPVRIRHGLEPRSVYYLGSAQDTEVALAREEGADLMDLSHRKKVVVETQEVVDEYHCKCERPSLLLGCDFKWVRVATLAGHELLVLRPSCFVRDAPAQ